MSEATTNVRGVDHIGITVPDIEAATRFLTEAFGAVVLYDMLDGPLSGELIETALEVPKGTVLEHIRMMRLGESASIELFRYSHVEQRKPVVPSDFGLQHFCVYVDDIDAAAKRFAAAGGTCFGEPMDLPGKDAGAGNRFLYCRAPWGTVIELVTYPSPQAYEATTKIRRWRPPARK
jgi:catechol 2,3-dioxygenase-like lactoylglutathione lyase family enzyme